MNLIIDIGNSRVKIAIMNGNHVIKSLNIKEYSEAKIVELMSNYPINRSIICSTRGDAQSVSESLYQIVGHCIVFDHNCPIPILNSYGTPTTLGRDRLAAAVGASTISEANNQLIIDMGTAITIDLVTRSGGFEGGVISPGVMMRFRALNTFTASLPMCSPTNDVVDIARTTKEAIEQGVMEGILYEIEGHITKMVEKFGEIDIIFAGGDLKYFENKIKNTIFASSELVFVGLNRILEYNAK